MRLLFISASTTANDRIAWSGTVYQALKGLERAGFEIDYLYAMRDYQQTFIDKLLCSYWIKIPKLFGKTTRMDESFYSVKIYKKTLSKFDFSPYDIVFVPTHISILNAIPRNIKAKIIYLTDATVDSLFGYYTEFSNLIYHNYWEAHCLGKRAFKRSDLVIVSSDWCKHNAKDQYGIDETKIQVVEFGANIDSDDIPEIHRAYNSKKKLHIYWSGVNWERKGGSIALECCRVLIDKGINVEFHITGIRDLPERIDSLSWVHNYGFLNKNNANDYHTLINIMSKQDIFLFPSIAECSSIALCEANAFGLPCFVYDTGGTSNYVKEGYNGYLLPLGSSGSDFANKIKECIDNNQLKRLSANARQMYLNRLNWNTWSKKVRKGIESIMFTKEM